MKRILSVALVAELAVLPITAAGQSMNMMKLLAMLWLLVIAGCATLMNDGQGESVTIHTVDCPKETTCVLSNKRGSWDGEPGKTVIVAKSDDRLLVHCEAPTGEAGSVYLDSVGDSSIWFGGLIGAAVDGTTDAHRQYADVATVQCR